MTEVKVIKIKDFKLKNVKFSSTKQNKHGGKVVYINYDYEDGKPPKPLRIQMPKMKAPFGISGWDKDRADKSDTSPTEQSNDTLELSISSGDEVIEKLEELDSKAIEEAIANSKEYFKKKFDATYIKMQFKSAIKFNENDEGERDGKYPPRLKTKLYKDKNSNYKLQLFNSAKELVNVDVYNHSEVLPKGCECVTILECAGIWIINDKFGLSWRPVQMKVHKSDLKLSGYSFIADEDNEDEEDTDQEIQGDLQEETEQGETIENVEDDLDKLTVEEPAPLPTKSRKRTNHMFVGPDY